MHNKDIRKRAKELNIYMYELADYLQVHENTLYRYLRKELSTEQKNRIFDALDTLNTGKVDVSE